MQCETGSPAGRAGLGHGWELCAVRAISAKLISRFIRPAVRSIPPAMARQLRFCRVSVVDDLGGPTVVSRWTASGRELEIEIATAGREGHDIALDLLLCVGQALWTKLTGGASRGHTGCSLTRNCVRILRERSTRTRSGRRRWGQAAAVNVVDGTVNTAANPVEVGGFISLFATGEGQTAPAGVDGKVANSTSVGPVVPVTATVGGIPADVLYAGARLGKSRV
jgi:hypothetical protein